MNQTFKAYLLCLFFLTFPLVGFSQNLVPNGGFETGNCESYAGNIDECDDWYFSLPVFTTATAEWFHQCMPEVFFQPPEVAFGAQEAIGDGYAGLIAHSEATIGDWDVREIIGVQLTEPLIEGNSYMVSMKYSHITYYPEFARLVNNFGINFSTHQFYDTASFPLNQSHLSIDTIVPLSNQDEWLEISQVFEADSNYQYLHIGNFFSNDSTESVLIGESGSTHQYYVVDEVSVTSVLSDEFLEKKTIKVFPNPVKDSFIIELIQNEIIEKVELIFLDGRALRINIPMKACVSCEFYVPPEVSAGLYLLRATTLDHKTYQTRIVIEK